MKQDLIDRPAGAVWRVRSTRHIQLASLECQVMSHLVLFQNLVGLRVKRNPWNLLEWKKSLG